MDMPAPKRVGAASNPTECDTLVRIAQALGCSPECFFEQATTGHSKNASLLMQTWLAIRSPKGRDAVFAFAREMLRSEKR